MAEKTKTVKVLKLSAVITEEKGEFVALCPELDIASQGKTIKEALAMLKEAVELYFEGEDGSEINGSPAFLTTFEVKVNA